MLIGTHVKLHDGNIVQIVAGDLYSTDGKIDISEVAEIIKKHTRISQQKYYILVNDSPFLLS